MSMKQPMISLFVEGGTVPAHRVGKGGLEKIVVPTQDFFQDFREFLFLLFIDFLQTLHIPSGEQKEFKRPNCPIGNHRKP